MKKLDDAARVQLVKAMERLRADLGTDKALTQHQIQELEQAVVTLDDWLHDELGGGHNSGREPSPDGIAAKVEVRARPGACSRKPSATSCLCAGVGRCVASSSSIRYCLTAHPPQTLGDALSEMEIDIQLIALAAQAATSAT